MHSSIHFYNNIFFGQKECIAQVMPFISERQHHKKMKFEKKHIWSVASFIIHSCVEFIAFFCLFTLLCMCVAIAIEWILLYWFNIHYEKFYRSMMHFFLYVHICWIFKVSLNSRGIFTLFKIKVNEIIFFTKIILSK